MTACRFSLEPFGEPGRVTMMVLFRTPATGLDIVATMKRSARHVPVLAVLWRVLTGCHAEGGGQHAMNKTRGLFMQQSRDSLWSGNHERLSTIHRNEKKMKVKMRTSGVLSEVAKPVPPVVTIRLIPSAATSVQSIICLWI